ncbi:hypothetical protein G6O69_02485 [Pseudenhygromyxa sp. WMMC2535]|uniref:hypothetical protein n=1 Tax=Pseudenhygromyxa sp. WMMC2535 TaxID=2712867 RepID=UPI0015552636|nr:hypothetical protein [Pseudenhygromyxa sp. WMMC2535]NVB36682.1 hypothetical protein [Pseudenhygromyxa sp. WMMC2535]
MSTTADRRRLLAGRASVAVAVALVLIGALRFLTDTLHEMNPNYWRALSGTPLRYLVRAPSDGSVAGWLNAQCFKLLAMPTGLALVWLGFRFGSGTLEDKRERFVDPVIRGVWLGSFLAGFTLIELEKQFHMLGMGTMLLEGERPWLNHLLHLIGFGLAWGLGSLLAFEPLRQSEIDLERELEELGT